MVKIIVQDGAQLSLPNKVMNILLLMLLFGLFLVVSKILLFSIHAAILCIAIPINIEYNQF